MLNNIITSIKNNIKLKYEVGMAVPKSTQTRIAGIISGKKEDGDKCTFLQIKLKMAGSGIPDHFHGYFGT
jgi:hypothetical protein